MYIFLTGIHLDYAINNKLTPFISMQNHHSLIYREEEREMFPTLKVCPTPCSFLLEYMIHNFPSYSASGLFPGLH